MTLLNNMKKGFTSVNVLMAIIVSMFVVNVIFLSLNGLKRVNVTNDYQDILSALQLYQIFNVSCDVSVFEQSISFKYLNEERTLRHINGKIVMSPGTVIYYSKVKSFQFDLQNNKIYLTISREKEERKYLIGEACVMDSH